VSVHALFVPRVSLIHRLDPRTKLIVWIMIATPALIANSILLSLMMFSLTVALAFLAKVPELYVKNITKILLPVFVPIFLIQGLFNPSGRTPILYLLPGLYFRREGIVFAAILLTRLLAIFGGAYLLNLTTYPGDLMASMQKIGLPLKIAYPLFSALQIVPMLESRLQVVEQAQMSRGLKLQKIGIRQRLRNFVPLLTPLLLGAIEEAYRRSIALEARGFSSKVKKTFVRDPRMSKIDVGFLAALLVTVSLLSILVFSIIPNPNPWDI
jgi:energy-coupling factor transport system permease protein